MFAKFDKIQMSLLRRRQPTFFKLLLVENSNLVGSLKKFDRQTCVDKRQSYFAKSAIKIEPIDAKKIMNVNYRLLTGLGQTPSWCSSIRLSLTKLE